MTCCSFNMVRTATNGRKLILRTNNPKQKNRSRLLKQWVEYSQATKRVQKRLSVRRASGDRGVRGQISASHSRTSCESTNISSNTGVRAGLKICTRTLVSQSRKPSRSPLHSRMRAIQTLARQARKKQKSTRRYSSFGLQTNG